MFEKPAIGSYVSLPMDVAFDNPLCAHDETVFLVQEYGTAKDGSPVIVLFYPFNDEEVKLRWPSDMTQLDTRVPAVREQVIAALKEGWLNLERKYEEGRLAARRLQSSSEKVHRLLEHQGAYAPGAWADPG